MATCAVWIVSFLLFISIFRFDHYGLLYDASNSFCSFSSPADELSLLTFQSFLSVALRNVRHPIPPVCVGCVLCV